MVSSLIDSSGPGVYTALDQLTMDKRNGKLTFSHSCHCMSCVPKHSFVQNNFLKSNNRKIIPLPCWERKYVLYGDCSSMLLGQHTLYTKRPYIS